MRRVLSVGAVLGADARAPWTRRGAAAGSMGGVASRAWAGGTAHRHPSAVGRWPAARRRRGLSSRDAAPVVGVSDLPAVGRPGAAPALRRGISGLRRPSFTHLGCLWPSPKTESSRVTIEAPRRRPFLSAQWRDLVMLNYAVDGAILEPLVPACTTLDRWRDRALVSLVGFR